MGLFDNLFGGGQGASAAGAPSGLFSTSSRFASAPAAPQPAAAAAGKPTAAAGSSVAGGKKKKRKHEEQQQPASKQQEQQQQRQGRAQAAEQTGAKKKKQAKDQAAAAAAAAAAAVATTAEAGAAEQQPKKKQKGDGAAAKQQGSSMKKPAREEQRAAGTGAAAAAPSKPAKESGNKAAGGKEAGGKAGRKAVAAAADDGAGEDERLPRTVFVGNLPATVKRKALARLFASCGAVESVRLRSLPLKQGDPGSKEAKMPRRGAIASGKIDAEHSAHAYVVFKEEAAVEAALKLNMTEFEGHHLRVDRAAPKAAKGAVLFDHARSLFVGNLPLDVEDEELIQLFGAEGVEAVRVVRDGRTGAGKGVAFVLFRSQDTSRAALKRHRKDELRGRQLRLTLVKKGEGGGKGGKASWQQGQGGGGGKGGGGKGGKVAGKRKPGGKRPAVAARKAASKLKARAGGIQKR